MRLFKLAITLVLLAAFFGSKAHVPVHSKESKKAFVVLFEKKLSQKVSGEDEDDDSPAKRKRRPRGIEVDVPQVADTLFQRSFTYNVYHPSWMTGIYSSFLFCVDRKRGPPLG